MLKKLITSSIFALVLLSGTTVNSGPWDPALVDVYSIELSAGVYAVVETMNKDGQGIGKSLATSAGFVIGDDGVLVIETFVNARLAKQLLDLIKKETDKPILYAVNTSYHGDHMYGNYMFKGINIIQHEETKKYIDEKWDKDIQFMTNTLGTGKGIEENIPRSGNILINDGIETLRIDLGNRIVEIRQFGFGQTEGDLQVWLPEEKVMWVGNQVPNVSPVTPWLTEGGHLDSLITMKKIREFLPTDAIVVPGHGRPFTLDEEQNGLDNVIDYLSTMDKVVRESVEKDLGFRETAKLAQMRDHPSSGYELYNWTHFQINLPCTYLYYHEKLGKGNLQNTPTIHCFHKNTGSL
jgi:cyclase